MTTPENSCTPSAEKEQAQRSRLRNSGRLPVVSAWTKRALLRLTQQANRRPTRGRKPAGGRPVERRVRHLRLPCCEPASTLQQKQVGALATDCTRAICYT